LLIAIFSFFFVASMTVWFAITYNADDVHDDKLVYTISFSSDYLNLIFQDILFL